MDCICDFQVRYIRIERQVGLIVNLLLEYWLRGYYEPPHRTGHEVFPHPALQEYILYVCLYRA
uniref:Uncharacterized protein n=1 Tax=Uncultured archaeon GZfos26G2 TaxID=3386331 RepID=Q64B19_UNCAG|nr:hypothetical protein GZ28B8_4 [uncultured archaeon GZfos28B8]